MRRDAVTEWPRRETPREVGLNLLWAVGCLAALAGTVVWPAGMLIGLVHGGFGDCTPANTSAGRWDPVFWLAAAGFVCDVAGWWAMVKRDRAWSVASGLLALAIFGLIYLLGPDVLDVIASHRPSSC